MNTEKPSVPLDFEAGLRTSPEDVLALRRARRRKPMSLQEYLEFLRLFEDAPASVLRARRGPQGDKAFVL